MSGFTLKHGLLLVPMAYSSTVFAVEYLDDSQAQKILLPDADEFIKKTITLTDDQLEKIKNLSGKTQRNSKPNVWEVKKKGKGIGFFFKDEVVGKHEYITYAVATKTDGSVVGMEIMSYRETHGGEVRQEKWRQNFKGKMLSDPFKLDVDVPNITGATLSCRNVLDGVKRLLALQTIVQQ
ncbi:MAG: FMN-binding protein [Pseudobdellovibrio sp.]